MAAQVVSLVLPIRHRLPRIGGKKLYYLLQEPLRELGVGRDRLFDILRANYLLIERKRNYQTTTDSRHPFRKHRNLVLDRIPERPEQVWVSDITYIGGQKEHLYLALVTDAYSKKIVGYDLSESLDAGGASRALSMANKNREYPQEILIHHSDRGVQYCCNRYQRLLQKYKMKVSMTQNYDPYANAVAERVNGILKQEFMLEQMKVKLKEMKIIVRQSIQDYNQLRPHLSCGMLTPNQMHKQKRREIKVYRKKSRLESRLTNKLI